MSVSPLNVVLSMVKEGRLVALANTCLVRSPLMPDVPTLTELGYGEAASNSWFGLHAPAGTPMPVVQRLSAALRAAMDDPKVRQQFVTAGTEPGYLDTAGFNTFMVMIDSKGIMSSLKGVLDMTFIDQETVAARRYVATLPTTR